MKTNTLVLIGLAALGIYLIFKNKNNVEINLDNDKESTNNNSGQVRTSDNKGQFSGGKETEKIEQHEIVNIPPISDIQEPVYGGVRVIKETVTPTLNLPPLSGGKTGIELQLI